MALAAANASLYAPSYYYSPNLAVRALPGAVQYAYPRAVYQAAAPQYILSAPALRLAAPAPAPIQVVAQPSLAVAVPNAA